MSIRAKVNARRLDQLVTFQRRVETPDGTGDPVVSWAPLVRCWAAVDGAKAFGAEPYVASSIRSVSDYTLWIRSLIFVRYALRVTDRVIWQGKVYNIADMPDQQLQSALIAVIVRTGLNDG